MTITPQMLTKKITCNNIEYAIVDAKNFFAQNSTSQKNINHKESIAEFASHVLVEKLQTIALKFGILQELLPHICNAYIQNQVCILPKPIINTNKFIHSTTCNPFYQYQQDPFTLNVQLLLNKKSQTIALNDKQTLPIQYSDYIIFDGKNRCNSCVIASGTRNLSQIYLLKIGDSNYLAQMQLPNLHSIAINPLRNYISCCYISDQQSYKNAKIYYTEYSTSSWSTTAYTDFGFAMNRSTSVPKLFTYIAPLKEYHIALDIDGTINILKPIGATFDRSEITVYYDENGIKQKDVFIQMAAIHHSNYQSPHSFIVVNREGMIFYYSFLKHFLVNAKNTLHYIDTITICHMDNTENQHAKTNYYAQCKLWATDNTLYIKHPSDLVEYKTIRIPYKALLAINSTPRPTQSIDR